MTTGTVLVSTKNAIGAAWGRLTTVGLAVGVGVLPILQGIDSTFVSTHPNLMWTVVTVSLVVAVLRVVAPPPAYVNVHRDDEMHVDHDSQSITIIKTDPLPPDLTGKPAGQAIQGAIT